MLPETVQMVQMSPHSPGPEAIIAAALTSFFLPQTSLLLVTET